jgi:hypothetical protein
MVKKDGRWGMLALGILKMGNFRFYAAKLAFFRQTEKIDKNSAFLHVHLCLYKCLYAYICTFIFCLRSTFVANFISTEMYVCT